MKKMWNITYYKFCLSKLILFSFLYYLASLIKTIIGGAQIIDLMILVVDITKGIQTQTAECLVIGEITCSKMIVVLNKIDSVPADKRNKTIEKVITVWNIQGENPKKERVLIL